MDRECESERDGDLGNGVHDVVDHHELGVSELVFEVDAQPPWREGSE